ncbi:MAG: hypothetical protein ACYC6N_25380 [Pirellulaceae bacterium]
MQAAGDTVLAQDFLVGFKRGLHGPLNRLKEAVAGYVSLVDQEGFDSWESLAERFFASSQAFRQCREQVSEPVAIAVHRYRYDHIQKQGRHVS